MTRTHFIILAMAGSAALLIGAIAFQVLGGLPPCKLCIWQRWPHGVAIGLGVLALANGHRFLPVLGCLVVLAGAGVALYHTGVEFAWWEGPNTCTSGSIDNLSTEQLLDQILNAPIVRCDEVLWSLFGLSMAAWNGIISLGIAAFWWIAARRT